MTQTIKAWSFSRLKVYEQCPYRAYLAFIEKRPEPPGIDKTHADRGTAIHAEIEGFIKGDTPELTAPAIKAKDLLESLRDNYKLGTVHVEDDWGFTLDWEPCGYFDDNVWCRMKLDALQLVTPTTVRQWDWKSGKKFGNEVSHAQQAQFYTIGTFMRLPEVTEVTTDFVYLDQPNCGPPSSRTYSREQAMMFFKSINDRAVAMTTTTTFPAKPNKINCRFCPYGPNNKGDRSCPWGVEI